MILTLFLSLIFLAINRITFVVSLEIGISSLSELVDLCFNFKFCMSLAVLLCDPNHEDKFAQIYGNNKEAITVLTFLILECR